MPDSLPPDHPAFGPCITVRRQRQMSRVTWIIALTLLSLLALFGLLGGVIAFLANDVVTAVFCVVASLAILVLPYPILRHCFKVVEFYEAGAVERVLGRRREFAFLGATTFMFAITREYSHGGYVGTNADLILLTAEGRTLRSRGRYIEHPDGLAIIESARTLQGEDPLDIVRDVIAGHVAQSLLARVAEGVLWSTHAYFTSEGIVLNAGRRKGELIQWHAISRSRDDRGRFSLFEGDEERPFLTLSINDWNFYPGLELFNILKSR